MLEWVGVLPITRALVSHYIVCANNSHSKPVIIADGRRFMLPHSTATTLQ